MHPYYYIHNQNTNITLPTAPITGSGDTSDDNPAWYKGTDLAGTYSVKNDNDAPATNGGKGSNF
jgi:hypothetical protein